MRPTKLQYPNSPRTDFSETLHGVEIPDPYRWMEDIDTPAIQDWINAQNQLSSAYLEDIPERNPIRDRLTELWDYEKFGLPVRAGQRYFYTYNNGLQNQSALYWTEGLQGEPHLLLDPNRLSADGTVALIDYQISEDGRLLAYGLSAAGSDWQEWRVRAVDIGEDLTDHIQWIKFSSAAWDADGQGFYYSRYAAPADGLAYKGANYDQKLYYHRLGEPQSQDRLVYERPDHKEWGFAGRPGVDGRYLAIEVWQGTLEENAFFYKDLQDVNSPIVELLPNFDASYHFLGNLGTWFYFFTDLQAPLGRVIAIDVRQPEPGAWREIISQTSDTLQNAVWVDERILALYLQDACSRLRVFDTDGKFLQDISLPGLGSITGMHGKQNDHEAFFLFTSFNTPGDIYRYDTLNAQVSLERRPSLKFDPQNFVTEQVFYTSHDGTRVPMFLTYKKGLKKDGEVLTLLHGYGGFNLPKTPEFSLLALLWAEIGGLFAQACLRGGGEYGRAWHEGGMKLNKQNVFDDFISAGEWLVSTGYTRPGRLSIYGRSNGGLLTGACLAQRPDLFGAALVVVGVLDMLRFHKFTIGWSWVSDYGSPDDPAEFKALYAYSPYHHLKPGTSYPPALITTGDHDDRVFPAHSFKFAAALQHAQAGSAPVLIRVDTRAGHGMGKPTAKLIAEYADMLAFLAHFLEIRLPVERPT